MNAETMIRRSGKLQRLRGLIIIKNGKSPTQSWRTPLAETWIARLESHAGTAGEVLESRANETSALKKLAHRISLNHQSVGGPSASEAVISSDAHPNNNTQPKEHQA